MKSSLVHNIQLIFINSYVDAIKRPFRLHAIRFLPSDLIECSLCSHLCQDIRLSSKAYRSEMSDEESSPLKIISKRVGDDRRILEEKLLLKDQSLEPLNP